MASRCQGLMASRLKLYCHCTKVSRHPGFMASSLKLSVIGSKAKQSVKHGIEASRLHGINSALWRIGSLACWHVTRCKDRAADDARRTAIYEGL